MSLYKIAVAATATTIEQGGKVINTSLPLIGETLYHATSWLCDSTRALRRESLYEGLAEQSTLVEKHGITAAQIKEVENLLKY